MATQIEERRRTRIDLLASIIEVSLNGSRKNQIMSSANINPRDLSGITDFLVEKELLYVAHVQNEGKQYRVTARGLRFLESYRKISQALE